MGKRSPTPPPPPDPAQLAATQGAMNTEQMRLNARINRPNQTTPFGSSTWTQGPDDQWSETQTYDPRITNAYFTDLETQQQAGQMAQMLGRGVTQTIFDQQGHYTPFGQNLFIPAAVDHIDPGTSGPNGLSHSIDASGLPSLSTGGLQGNLDTNGLTRLPGAGRGEDNFSAERGRQEDALYARNTSRLDPQWEQRQAALESQLTNQGFMRGTEAWNQAMDSMGRDRNDAYAGARNDSILAGGEEQSRLFANALQARGQQFGERESMGNFTNSANAQDFDQRMRARGQGFGERQTQATFGNQANAQDFGQRMNAAQFQNAIRGQRYQEELTQRNQPFEEFMRMVHGNSSAMPQFSNPTQIQGMPPPDYMAAYGMNQAAQNNAYNQQMGSRNNLTSALVNAGGKAAMAMSDRRLKSNVKRIGDHSAGVPLYEYDIFGRREVGVMADELQAVRPDAVATHPSGYLMVNYAKIGGRDARV